MCDNTSTAAQECLFRALGLLLQGESSVSLLGSLFSTLRYFIITYPQTLFRWANTSYCGDLCFEILRHCNLPHAVVRAKAAALFYLLIKARIPYIHVLLARILIVLCVVHCADQLRGDKVDCAHPAAVDDRGVAAHRYGEGVLVPDRVAGRRHCLHQARRPQHSPAGRNRELMQEAARGSTRHTTHDTRHTTHDTRVIVNGGGRGQVIKHSLDMAEYAYDREMTTDLYYQVSLGYTDSPDLRVTWLDNLGNFHLEVTHTRHARHTCNTPHTPHTALIW